MQLEDLAGCAARELREEVKIQVDPSELVLVDVRSSPSRDYRGHVVDHGYAWFVPAEREEEVRATLQAGDDAKSAYIVPVVELVQRSMAFDHKELLIKALKMPRPVSVKKDEEE